MKEDSHIRNYGHTSHSQKQQSSQKVRRSTKQTQHHKMFHCRKENTAKQIAWQQ